MEENGHAKADSVNKDVAGKSLYSVERSDVKLEVEVFCGRGKYFNDI